MHFLKLIAFFGLAAAQHLNNSNANWCDFIPFSDHKMGKLNGVKQQSLWFYTEDILSHTRTHNE